MCQHYGRTYERTEARNGVTLYLYVCHDCQEGFYSTIAPSKNDRWRDDSDFDWE